MEKKTVEEVLELTAGMLSRIMIPAGLMKEIGAPVSCAIENLQECIKAIRAAKKPEGEDNDVPGE